MNTDLYEILGVKKDAGDDEIKSAYRKLAKEWHPDKHKGDKEAEKKFKEINGAYEILSDKKKRQQYDTFGAAGGQGGAGFGGGFGGAQGFDFSGFGDGASSFADIFETFFGGGAGAAGFGGGGGGRRRAGPTRGNDIEADIHISFQEAVFGTEKEIEVTKPDKCEHCEGKGVEPGSKMVECKTCQGKGEIRSVRNTILGQVATTQICGECGGTGEIPEKKCTVCHGTTRVRKSERITVKIPAGVDQGSTIRIAGKGEAGLKGGQNGDLYINLQVEPSKEFLRHGSDIHSTLEIPVVQAVLGAEVEVKTIRDKAKIKVPAGTQDGKVFKLSSEGVARLNSSGTGDHYVKIRIKVPEKLSKKERELYEQLAEEGGTDFKKGGFFN